MASTPQCEWHKPWRGDSEVKTVESSHEIPGEGGLAVFRSTGAGQPTTQTAAVVLAIQGQLRMHYAGTDTRIRESESYYLQ